MMRSFKKPFLIADPRVEGGGFYVGSEELEERIIQKIYEKLDWLVLITPGNYFWNVDGNFWCYVLRSPISAACHYSLSKPLASIGNIAHVNVLVVFQLR